MEGFLTSIGLIVTESIEWVVAVANTITSTPILLITTGFLCLGAAVGLFGRMLSKN